jgi:hypothetical protein
VAGWDFDSRDDSPRGGIDGYNVGKRSSDVDA